MDHLDEHRLLDLLREPPTAREAEHLDRCPRCRRELESWETTLAELRELDAEELSGAEIHNLRTLFRQLGPSRRRWIAELVRPLHAPAMAPATRGPLTASLAEYRAGDLSVILHVAPSTERGLYEVHGTVQSEAATALDDTSVVLSADDGFADIAETDRFGEFHFHGVPAGRYRVSCVLDSGSVEVEDLPVGETRDDDDG